MNQSLVRIAAASLFPLLLACGSPQQLGNVSEDPTETEPTGTQSPGPESAGTGGVSADKSAPVLGGTAGATTAPSTLVPEDIRDTKGRTAAELACSAQCQLEASIGCSDAGNDHCVSDCVQLINAVPACVQTAVAASDCYGRLPPNALECRGGALALVDATTCAAANSSWKACVAQNVTPKADCLGVCEKNYVLACPNPSKFEECQSNCSITAVAITRCTAELSVANACLVAQPVVENTCVNGEPVLVQGCLAEAQAFADCYKAD